MKRTIAYCRLSREDKEKGAGFEIQERELRRKIDDRDDLEALTGYGINQDFSPRKDGFFFEDFSGTGIRKRKIFFGLLEGLCKVCANGIEGMCWGKQEQGNELGVGALLVYDTDRLARNTKEFLQLKEFFSDHKVELVVAMGVQFQDPEKPRAMEEGMQEMKAVFDSLYPKFVRDKVKDAFEQKSNIERRWWGRIPPGFKVRIQDGKIQPRTSMVIQIIRYLLMGYNAYEIGELGMAENIDGKYHRYNATKVWRLKRTLQRESEKYGKNGRIVLPDALYDVQPLTNHTSKRASRSLKSVHSSSSVSEMEIAQNPNLPSGQKEETNRFWKKIQKQNPELLYQDSELLDSHQELDTPIQQNHHSQEESDEALQNHPPQDEKLQFREANKQESSSQAKTAEQKKALEESFHPMFDLD
jgi:DNA invertase Pin-like site-specific DNA recombinase